MRTPGSCADVAQPSLDVPMHQERLGHHVAQESQTGMMALNAVG